MFQKQVIEKVQTHILASVFFSVYRTVYEIMWKNILQPHRSQTTIPHMRIACWLNTHSPH